MDNTIYQNRQDSSFTIVDIPEKYDCVLCGNEAHFAAIFYPTNPSAFSRQFGEQVVISLCLECMRTNSDAKTLQKNLLAENQKHLSKLI